MILTLRPAEIDIKHINKLKEMFLQKRATTAIFQAIDYVVNHKEKNEKMIEDLTEKLDLALSNGEDIRLLIDQIKKAGHSLLKYSKSGEIDI